MWQFESEVAQIIQRTPTVKSFQFPVRASGVRYLPGQFFFLTIKIDGREAIHHFSFSSAPTDKGYIEFTKRITGSEFSQALNVLKPGDWARLRGPEGNFTLPRRPRKLGFLSGGIGITALRSMLRYIVHKKLPFDVVLFYGNSSLEEIAFRDELAGLAAANSRIRIEHILSNPPGDWKDKAAYINSDVIAKLAPDYRERTFYISGPPKMVITLEDQLIRLNVPASQILRDSFTGYD